MHNAPPELVPGQRLVSDSEPELGLGTFVSTDGRTVVVRFEAAEEERRYAARSAPLHRVVFAAGDEIIDIDGARHVVDALEERDGLAVYRSGELEVLETELSPRMSLGGPRERLFAGRFDPPRRFDLRVAALAQRERALRSPVRGLIGARLELLPHQFYIASEVTSRRQPRVLLADQTGLGKTIEACLILHRLLLTGRAQRALILVPDALVHQWLVELSRRFNLRVALFDETRCTAVEEGDPGANPFDTEQFVLAGWSLVVGNAKRTAQAAEAGWDVVVIDEAHHLTWADGQGGPGYTAVEAIAGATEGLLLLTATPTQLGEEGHFARLRLLDPERHTDYAAWRDEDAGHQEAATIGTALVRGGPLGDQQVARLAALLGVSADTMAARIEDPTDRERVLAELIDRHGPGRVIFANTRAVLSELPRREVRLIPLSAPPLPPDARTVLADDDPRIDHLIGLLHESSEKLLVICRTAALARAIKAAIEVRLRADIALFHEDIELVQRDRNAAWFVEPDGARMLICSEIGSEGRNFQHARHLVMFDLPVDPDLVEQRIGRVDRIGQRGDVVIDVPFAVGSGHEVLARWHHEGVGSLARPITTAQPLLEQFGARVRKLARRWDKASGNVAAEDLDELITETATAAKKLEARVEEGRDRLLEMSSLRPEVAARLLEEVSAHDDDQAADELFLVLLEHFQVIAEQIAPRTYRFDSQGLARVKFAGLTQGDVTFTFDREAALLREDYEFASLDHPLLHDAIGFLLDAETGNASFAIHAHDNAPSLIVETVFILEVVAPPRLHADRFLPPTIVRVAVDQTGRDCTDGDWRDAELGKGNRGWFRDTLPDLRRPLREAIERAESLAANESAALRSRAAEQMTQSLEAEITRLRALAATNDNVRPEEIALVEHELAEIRDHIGAARLRLEAIRVIWSGPAEDGVPLLL
jgi:ATP-dependent helicase HepA